MYEYEFSSQTFGDFPLIPGDILEQSPSPPSTILFVLFTFQGPCVISCMNTSLTVYKPWQTLLQLFCQRLVCPKQLLMGLHRITGKVVHNEQQGQPHLLSVVWRKNLNPYGLT